MIVTLTKCLDNKYIKVNAIHILMFFADSANYTIVELTGDRYIEVLETPDEIESKINSLMKG